MAVVEIVIESVTQLFSQHRPALLWKGLRSSFFGQRFFAIGVVYKWRHQILSNFDPLALPIVRLFSILYYGFGTVVTTFDPFLSGPWHHLWTIPLQMSIPSESLFCKTCCKQNPKVFDTVCAYKCQHLLHLTTPCFWSENQKPTYKWERLYSRAIKTLSLLSLR